MLGFRIWGRRGRRFAFAMILGGNSTEETNVLGEFYYWFFVSVNRFSYRDSELWAITLLRPFEEAIFLFSFTTFVFKF